MSMKQLGLTFCIVYFGLCMGLRAETEAPTTGSEKSAAVSEGVAASAPVETQPSQPDPQDPSQIKKPSTHRKGRASREKEAEGTQAPNRFDADIILKSKYELNGQSLEVDPD